MGWSPDLIACLRDKILQRFQLTSAWQSINTGVWAALLDTVKTRVLNFVLEIEAVAPSAGEPSQREKPIWEERVQQVFNTYVLGGYSQVAGGNQTTEYNTDIKIVQNDFDSLSRLLSSLGLGEDSIQELSEAIREDDKYQDRTGSGSRVQTWLGKMILKAADGSWKIGTSVAANLLTRALVQYYGI